MTRRAVPRLADVIDLGMIPGLTLANLAGGPFTLPDLVCACDTLITASPYLVDVHDPAARRLVCGWCATTARQAGHPVEHLIEGDEVWLADPGGRCPTCQQTYPRRIPAGQDQRCWTCSLDDTAWRNSMNNDDERDYDEEAANRAEMEQDDHCIGSCGPDYDGHSDCICCTCPDCLT